MRRGGAGRPPFAVMKEISQDSVRTWLAARVDEERLRHSLRVLELIPGLAAAHGADAEPLKLAALLHDSARGMSDAEMLKSAERLGLPVRDIDRRFPILLHGRLAVEMARRELEIDDAAVLSAVLYHTAGHPLMSLSDKLLFLGDMIEPERALPRLDELRLLAYDDVNGAMRLAIEINRRYLAARGRVMDPLTLELKQALTP